MKNEDIITQLEMKITGITQVIFDDYEFDIRVKFKEKELNVTMLFDTGNKNIPSILDAMRRLIFNNDYVDCNDKELEEMGIQRYETKEIYELFTNEEIEELKEEIEEFY